MALTTFSAHDTIRSSEMNDNFSQCVLTSTAKTITVTHTWSSSQTFSGGWAAAAACVITVASSTAFAVGPNGSTNPAFLVDSSTPSSATGIKVKSAAAASGVAVSVTSSGTDENLKLDAKGSGTITIGGTSTGAITLGCNTTISGQITTEPPSGSTAGAWRLGEANSVSPTSPNRTIAISIGSSVYYLHAKTTND